MSRALLTIRIAAFAAIVPLLLRLRLDRVGRLLEPRSTPAAPDLSHMRELAALVDRVLEGGKPLLRSGCLVRGLTQYYILRRAGAQLRLCFGIGPHEQRFVGHCWLETVDGEPYLESHDPRPMFTPVYRWPS